MFTALDRFVSDTFLKINSPYSKAETSSPAILTLVKGGKEEGEQSIDIPATTTTEKKAGSEIRNMVFEKFREDNGREPTISEEIKLVDIVRQIEEVQQIEMSRVIGNVVSRMMSDEYTEVPRTLEEFLGTGPAPGGSQDSPIVNNNGKKKH